MTTPDFYDRYYSEESATIAAIINVMPDDDITHVLANIAPERLRQETARRLIEMRRLAAA